MREQEDHNEARKAVHDAVVITSLFPSFEVNDAEILVSSN